VSEPFIPTEAQQGRLSEDEYAALALITLGLLHRIEQENTLPSQDEVDTYIQRTQAEIRARIMPPTEALLAGDASLAEWEMAISEGVVNAVILGLLLASGGVDGLRNTQDPRAVLQFTKTALVADLRGVRFSADRIAAGDMSPAQILASLDRRSGSLFRNYSSAVLVLTLMSGQANEGIRRMGSQHPCPNCPDYERPNWTPLEEIIPPGNLCLCQLHCKCTLVTRYNPVRALQNLTGGSLTNRVQRAAQYQAEVEQQWLSSWVKRG
jgi:hypothetical protein